MDSCFYSRAILKISQPKGLRDPKCGGNFEPFGFIGGGWGMSVEMKTDG